MDFGDVDDPAKREETAMQTSDNNIVYLEFLVLYRYADPFESLYRVRDVDTTLREASQAAMREVVGRNTIDGVLSDARGQIEADVADLLQTIVTSYELGLEITGVDLQEVQPPRRRMTADSPGESWTKPVENTQAPIPPSRRMAAARARDNRWPTRSRKAPGVGSGA